MVVSQLMARFPYGMLSIAVLLYIHDRTGSYAIAGAVLATSSIGQAIAGPMTSRLMGIWGMRPVLILTTSVASVTMTVVTVFALEPVAYMALGFVIGLSMPPVQSAVRTIYPKMVNGQQLTPLYSLDASAQEIIWIIGPVLATFAATQLGGVWAMALCIVFMVGGGAWFVTAPELGRVRIPRSRRRFGAVLIRPPVLMATAVGFLLVGCYAAAEAGVVTAFGQGSPEGGVVLAICAVGSMIGGLGFGHLPIRPWSLARRMLLVFSGVALALAAMNFWWLALTLFLSGLGTAPALAAIFTIVSASVKFSDTAEAYGWIGTGQLIGAALGSAASGVLIDRVGSVGAFAIAAVFGLFGVLVPALGRRALPDLKGRDSTPQPDTEPVAALS